MSLASLYWGAPAWVWLALAVSLAAVTAVVWSYRRAPASLVVRCLAALFKTLAVLALAACLIEPLWSGMRPRPGANLFALLVDDSQSLQIRDPGSGRTRAQMARELVAQDTGWQTRLSQDFDVRRYRFAQRLRSLDDLAELDGSGDASCLKTALSTIGKRYGGRPLAGVLVFTDGNATDWADDQIDFSGLPPIYPVPLGTEAEVKDVSIGPVSVSQTNFEQSPVTIRADVTAAGYGDEKLAVQLLDEQGEQLEEQTVEADEGEPHTVRFRVRPDGSGVHFYQVRAVSNSERWQLDPSTEKEPVEATLANNTKLACVERPKGPYRVLYVSGRPNWEFKFLRRALAKDGEVKLVGLIRIAKREPKFAYLGRTGETTNPLYRGFSNQDDEEAEQYDEPVLIRLGTQDDAELRDGFPTTADELFPYHAIILDDLEAAYFTQDQLLLIQRYVSRRGGGLLMLGGAESFRQGEFARTPVGELLPVYLDRQPAATQDARYQLTLTREGWLQPWTRLRETEEAEKERFDAMPVFDTLNQISGIKPGASILAEATDQNGKRHPALVSQRFGKGRAAALMIGDMWQWGLGRKSDEEDDLARAWRQLIRWLVAEVPRQVEVDVRKTTGSTTDPVEIRVNVSDSQFLPMDNVAVEMEVTTPDGKQQKLRADSSQQQAGMYVAKCGANEPGAYRAKVTVAAPDGHEIGVVKTGWTAEPAASEFRRLSPDLALLERIARETGGEMVEPNQLDEFVTGLPNRKIPITEPWVYPLWHQPAIFLFAICCLLTEWGLRRWRGLP